MKFYLFIGEIEDHGLKHVNPDFPLFLLCGVLMSHEAYERLKTNFNELNSSHKCNTQK